MPWSVQGVFEMKFKCYLKLKDTKTPELHQSCDEKVLQKSHITYGGDRTKWFLLLVIFCATRNMHILSKRMALWGSPAVIFVSSDKSLDIDMKKALFFR